MSSKTNLCVIGREKRKKVHTIFSDFRAVLPFTWSIEKLARWLFLKKKATQRQWPLFIPTGELF
jgi:hypothetical protein